jgi:hypothetical protein
MIYVYTWTGTGFTHQTYNTPATLSKILAINPLVEGEFLAFSSSGLYYYTSKGQQYTKIANINSCNGVSWGKPAPGKTNPTVFVFGKYGLESVSRVYRSDDGMKTWVRVSDDNSLFGGVLTKNIICGDMNTYGRVYVSNSGIGLVYGDIDTQSAVNEVGFRKSNELAKLSANPFRFSTGIRSENKLQFSIFALNGKMVETGNIQGNTEIGIQLNSGIYILKLIDVSNKAQQVIKLLKM